MREEKKKGKKEIKGEDLLIRREDPVSDLALSSATLLPDGELETELELDDVFSSSPRRGT